MQEKTKNILIAVLVVGLISMTVAYAAFTQNLTISSSAKVNNTKWDIKIKNFTQAAAQNNLVSGTSEATVSGPTSTSGTTISGLVVTFMKPGDVVKFTFDLANEGDIDAKLNGYTLGEPDTTTKVSKAIVCGSSTKAEPTVGAASMNLAKTTGTIPCEMTLTLASDAVMPTGSTQTTVTIPDTSFVYGQA